VFIQYEKMKTETSLVDSVLNQLGFGWFQIRLCLLCCAGYFAVGSELLTMVMTQSGVMDSFKIGSTMEFSWLPFSANLATVVAAILVGKLSDKYGRKWPFITCIFLSAVFAVACAFAPSWEVLILLRSVVGFGLGGLSVIDFVVLVEVCPVAWRNTACQLVFFSGCLGVVYVALIGMIPWTDWLANIPAWRCMMVAGSIPLVITVFIRLVVSTDTPKFLVTTGRLEEAYDLLDRIAVTNSRSLDISKSEFTDSVQQLTSEKSERGCLKDVLRMTITLPLAVVWMIQSLVYWGLTAVLPVFFDSAGISPSTGLLFMGLAELPGVVIATIISQRESRSFALVVCWTISCIGALLTGLSLCMHWSGTVTSVFSSLFYMFLIPAWGVLFVLTPEVYPVKDRGAGVGFQHMCRSLPSLFAPFVGAALVDSTQDGLFMFIWSAILAGGVATSLWLSKLISRL
jgi:putative MFS transporter